MRSKKKYIENLMEENGIYPVFQPIVSLRDYGEEEVFIGHVGGDDFVLTIHGTADAQKMCEEISERFAEAVLYMLIEEKSSMLARLYRASVYGYIALGGAIHIICCYLVTGIKKDLETGTAERIGFERFQICYVDETADHVVGDVISTTGDKANAADRAFFKQAASGIPNISDVLFARIDLKMVICVSAPIYNDNGDVIGVLTGVTDASMLNDLVNEINVENNGFCFVINQTGTKMTAVDYADVENSQNDIVCNTGREAAEGVEAVEADPRYAELAAIEEKMIAGESGVDTYRFDGKKYFIGYAPILGGQWSFAMVGEQSAALAGTSKLVVGLVVLSIVFLIAGSLAIYVIGSRICNPIVRLTKNTGLLAEGNLNLEFDAGSLKNKNEIGDMARGLREVQENLRQIVTELQRSISSIKGNSADFSNAFDTMTGNVADVNNLVQEIASSSNSQANETNIAEQKVNHIEAGIEENANSANTLEKSAARSSSWRVMQRETFPQQTRQARI